MRIKSIPKGAKFVRFDNNSDKDAMIYADKKPFLFVRAKHYWFIDCKYFIVGFPLEEFPQTDLYANRYIDVTIKF